MNLHINERVSTANFLLLLEQFISQQEKTNYKHTY